MSKKKKGKSKAKKKGYGKKKPKAKKNPKRVAAAKKAYAKARRAGKGLAGYNKKKKGHGGKKKSSYSKKKSKARKKSRHKSYAAHQLARVDWASIARHAQKSKQRRAAAEAGFGGPPAAKYAKTAYLARLRKKHAAGGAKAGGLPAWF
jgi:hypothetical protein